MWPARIVGDPGCPVCSAPNDIVIRDDVEQQSRCWLCGAIQPGMLDRYPDTTVEIRRYGGPYIQWL
jgi:hypothetical protein